MPRNAALLMVLGLVACGAPSSDESRAPAGVPSSEIRRDSGMTAVSSWPGAVGEFLAMANATTGEALLFRRDTMATPGHIGVVGYDAVAASATLRAVRPMPCAARATLQMVNAPAGWTLALDSARAAPLLVDALEDLPAADSQRVVVSIQRALNTLPDTGNALEFRGLPVVVRDAWLVHGPGGRIVVARAARLRNLEATAHEDLRFVILEGGQPRYVARVAGDEETVESWELLAALILEGRLWLAVAREGVGSLQLELVERDSTGWRSAWRSDAIACGRSR